MGLPHEDKGVQSINRKIGILDLEMPLRKI